MPSMNRRIRPTTWLQLTLSAVALMTMGHVTAEEGQVPNLRVNGARVNAHLRELSAFGGNPQGGVSRVA